MLALLERQSSTQQQPKIKDEDRAVDPCGGGCTVLDPIGPNGALVTGNSLPFAPGWIFNGICSFQSSPVPKGIFGSPDWAYLSRKSFLLYRW